MAKIQALKLHKGNFEHLMDVTQEMRDDLNWWILHLPEQKRHINKGNHDITISSDASTVGWGGMCEGKGCGGRLTASEAAHHINYLEILAAFLALRSFAAKTNHKHVKLMIDNSTAVAYVNNMGGVRSKTCNEMAKTLWLWAVEKNLWLTATYIPGILNVEADQESRQFHDKTEWKLDPLVFTLITSQFGSPDIDLFASRLNTQIEKFVSWRPDPDASYVDAFTIDWNPFLFYAF